MPDDSRATVRCPECGLNQFQTAAGQCRRCGEPLQPTPVVIADATLPAPEPAQSPVLVIGGREHVSIAALMPERILQLRKLRRLSQRQLGKRMAVPRTYISKLECGHASPTLVSLQRLAQALGIPVATLVLDPAAFQAWLHGGFAADKFLREFLHASPQLNPAQREQIVNAAQSLAANAAQAAPGKRVA